MRRDDLDEQAFAQWVESLPAIPRAVAHRLPPDRIYRNTETGQMMVLQAYADDGTVRAYVIEECAGPFTTGVSVFGLDPACLVEATEAEYAARRKQYAPLRQVIDGDVELGDAVFRFAGWEV